MLGMRRPSSSLDHLESERASTKIPKQDDLSIYEATMQKLRQGSRLAFGTPAGGIKHDDSPSNHSSPNSGSLSTNSVNQLKRTFAG